MFRSLFTTVFRGSSAVFCTVTIPPAYLRSLSLYYYAVCGRMCVSSVCVWCSCLLVICLWTLFSIKKSPKTECGLHSRIYGTYSIVFHSWFHLQKNNTFNYTLMLYSYTWDLHDSFNIMMSCICHIRLVFQVVRIIAPCRPSRIQSLY
jgi:hypothetical protein